MGMVKKKFRYHPNNPRSPSDRHEFQLPITLYLNPQELDTPGLAIKVMYVQSLNLCVPYIAETMDDDDRKPFEIPDDLFPELNSKSYDRKNLKMRTFRYNLPREIARQYLYAELFQIEGFNHITFIESGSVIRTLLEKISDRLYSMEYVETFNTYPDPVEA